MITKLYSSKTNISKLSTCANKLFLIYAFEKYIFFSSQYLFRPTVNLVVYLLYWLILLYIK